MLLFPERSWYQLKGVSNPSHPEERKAYLGTPASNLEISRSDQYKHHATSFHRYIHKDLVECRYRHVRSNSTY